LLWEGNEQQGRIIVRFKPALHLPAVMVAAMLGIAGGARGTPASVGTTPCTLPGLASPARCGVLEVPENPESPKGRQLAIHFAIVPALSGKAAPDPIVPLMGGPGEDAISDAADAATQFAALRSTRDILLLDQRGTGQSGTLHCDLYAPDNPAASLMDVFPEKTVEACEKRLQNQADLTRYTYDYFARDLEQVRQALGYGPLNLTAGSYGTRAAQVYMRAYPQSVRTAYLGSVVPIDLPSTLMFARTAQTALEHMIQDCEEDAACHTAYPELRRDVAATFARLDGDRVRVSLPGRPDSATLGRGRVAEWVRSRLYRPPGAATLPKIFQQAASGDWAPIVDGVLSHAREGDDSLSFGLLFAIACSEDIPFVREQDIPAASEGTFLGTYRLAQQQRACAFWPRTALPPDYRRPLESAIPTLFVTGDRDGDTPLWFTDHVASAFTHRAIVVVRGQGHTGWNDCVARLYQQLVETGAVDSLDTSCPAVPLPPFKL
jgi:pimeloyl-ACP methyl ester carboxylesterase